MPLRRVLTAVRQVQTPTQRRANAKFAKEQEARMGKSTDQLKKRTKETPKSPISPLWIGQFAHALSPPVCCPSMPLLPFSRR